MLTPYREKAVRRVVGLMSGTSVDGIDAALVEISGTEEEPELRLLAFENSPYEPAVRQKIFELFDVKSATVDKIGYLNFLLGELYAKAALSVITKAGFRPEEIDVIGSHGQTIYHAPERVAPDGIPIGYTVQIGEGAVIAARAGIPCVSDFRVADMAVGGQGAPLVPFTEYLLYRKPDRSVLLQNIGGIGNITVIPKNCSLSEVFAFDTGPGNMLIDGLVQRLSRGKIKLDEGGRMAARGKVHEGLLAALQREPYYAQPAPKSTGRELFGLPYVKAIEQYLREYSVCAEDGMATVTYLTAWSIADAYRRFVEPKCRADEMIVGGGGSYNAALIGWMKKEMAAFGVRVLTQEEAGGNSDAKEAVAFALLADRALCGRVNSLPGVTGAARAVIMGKISL